VRFQCPTNPDSGLGQFPPSFLYVTGRRKF